MWSGAGSNCRPSAFQFYGHPGTGRASAAQLASQAVDCVLSCETRAGIIDGIHFIDPRWPTSCR